MSEYETNKGIGAYAAPIDDGETGECDTDGVCAGTRFNSTLLAVGVGIVLLGCLLFLDNLSVLPPGVRPVRLWPIIVVAVGVAKLAEQGFRRVSGWAITFVGLLLLLHGIGGKPLRGLVGPGILICAGVLLVLHARRRRLVRKRLEERLEGIAQRVRGGRRHGPPAQGEGEFAYGTAIASSYRYRPSGGEFSGGDVTAIFGGFEMDLSRMTMKSDAAKIEVFVMLGGGEIRVPEGWEVSVRVSAVAGGVEDKTIRPPYVQGQPPKLLVITGSLLFGGVTVKTRPYR